MIEWQQGTDQVLAIPIAIMYCMIALQLWFARKKVNAKSKPAIRACILMASIFVLSGLSYVVQMFGAPYIIVLIMYALLLVKAVWFVMSNQTGAIVSKLMDEEKDP